MKNKTVAIIFTVSGAFFTSFGIFCLFYTGGLINLVTIGAGCTQLFGAKTAWKFYAEFGDRE